MGEDQISKISINRKLNLVIPVEQDDGSTIYVHSTPIGRETFERYFKVLARTFGDIYSQGLNFTSGPRVAALMLKQIAQELNMWAGPGGVEQGLMEEIRRLSNVIVSSGRGWTTMLLDDAIKQDLFTEDDLSEIENAICFFIVASALHKKTELRSVLETVSKLWGARVELLSCSEFAAGLPTLTATDNFGAKATPSSIPH